MPTDPIEPPTFIARLRDIAHAFSMLVIAASAFWVSLHPAERPPPAPAPTPPAVTVPAKDLTPAIFPGQSVAQVREDVILAGSIQTYERFVEAVAKSVAARSAAK